MNSLKMITNEEYNEMERWFESLPPRRCIDIR